jgi:hypothetical protein
MTDGDADEEAARDLIIVPGMRTDRSNPLEEGRAIAKLGFDWTARADERVHWSNAQPPGVPTEALFTAIE